MLAAALVLPAGAQAAFPGPNGKIAFSDGGNIWTFYADGGADTQLTDSGSDAHPAWSADGQKIAFSSSRDGNAEIYVMEGTGVNETRLTNHLARDDQPTWSPDGQKIAFTRADSTYQVYVMNADGTGLTNLTNGQVGFDPAWSPDGQKIAFTNGNNLFVVNPDGTGRAQLTNYPPSTRDAFYEPRDPDWAPDGQRITYELANGGGGYFFTYIQVMNADGSADTSLWFSSYEPAFSPDGNFIVFDCSGLCVMPSDGSDTPTQIRATGYEPDWQQGPPRGAGPFDYARPKGATPVRVPLVPAYRECALTNTAHGSPLGWGSCKPPAQSSSYLTVGTPDANGGGANAVGSITYQVLAGDPSTPAEDEADVRITVSATDVRNKSGLSDYVGDVAAFANLRVTDHDNFTDIAGPDSGTLGDTFIRAVTPCTVTASATIGSTCEVTTTADTVVPGMVKEGARAIWELGQVWLLDASGGIFMDQGVFVP